MSDHTPNPYAPPTAVVDDAPQLLGGAPAPAMWNPHAAALWSLLFTPAFGAWLHMLNWRALGDSGKANESRNWLIGTIAALTLVAAIGIVLPESATLDILMRAMGFALLFGWYFSSGRAQTQFVLGRYGKTYPRRGWGMALLAGVVGIIAYLAVLFIIGFAAAMVFDLE